MPRPGAEKTTVAIQVPANTRYMRVLQALTNGMSIPEVAREFGMTRGQVLGVQHSARKRIEHIQNKDFTEQLSELAPLALMAKQDSLLNKEDYNRGKMADSYFKGLGFYKQDPAFGALIANQGVVNLVTQVVNYTEKDKKEIIDLERKAIAARAGDSEPGSQDHEPEDSDRAERAVVGEKLHQDV